MSELRNEPRIELSWRDTYRTIPIMLRLLLTKAPLLAIALVFLGTVISITPHSKESTLLKMLGDLATTLSISMATYVVVTAYWCQLTNKKTGKYINKFGRAGFLMVATYVYWIWVVLGLVIFVVPGILVAVRGALTQVIICLENRGPVLAMGESSRLTDKKTMLILKYFAPTIIMSAAMMTFDPVIIWLVDHSALKDSAFSSWTWSFEHVPAAITMSFFQILSTLMFLNIGALQVRLYLFLKELDNQYPIE